MTDGVSAKIRMFRLSELGDCFLVTFSHGNDKSNVLIDCGSFRNGSTSLKRLNEIAGEIQKEVGRKNQLDVVVGTHQHNDHLSGFFHCADQFRTIGVNQVWLSWLDDPADNKAQVIGERFHNVKSQLAAVRKELTSLKSRLGVTDSHVTRVASRLDDVLGFYGANKAGAVPEVPAKAIENLRTIGHKKPLYLKPGKSVQLPGLENSVRVHVLGPPRDASDDEDRDPLFRKNPRKGETYDAVAAAAIDSTRILEAFKTFKNSDHKKSRDEEHYPFNKLHQRRGKDAQSVSTRKVYDQSGLTWRKIDHDWMQQAESLALFLDTYTNNSSLVLAFEMVASGKVLLFAADAQVGNWASWNNVKWEDKNVHTDELLAKTVFYKVGHHGSHNATLVETFEKMTSPDLVAVIPVHKEDPNILKKNGWKMPATNLMTRLIQKTQGRVLQMDNVNPEACDPENESVKQAWNQLGITPKIGPMCIEIEIK